MGVKRRRSVVAVQPSIVSFAPSSSMDLDEPPEDDETENQSSEPEEDEQQDGQESEEEQLSEVGDGFMEDSQPLDPCEQFPLTSYRRHLMPFLCS